MSNYKEDKHEIDEGSLVANIQDILDVITKELKSQMGKKYQRNSRDGLGFINQVAQSVGMKVTDKKQAGGKLFLKLDNDLEEVRNYRKEYDNYHSRPEQKLRRAARNTARASLKDVPEDKDVHHKDNNPLNNDKSNLSVVTQKYNRSEPRKRERDAKLKEWADAVEENGKFKELTQEDMGTVTGPHIVGTGDDSSTVLVKKKKRIMKRIRDTVDYNKKGGHVK